MKLSQSPTLDEEKLKLDISSIIGDSLSPLKFLYLNSCDSTNVECLKLAGHNTIVVAEQQLAGRGRRGKIWHSPNSQNIYCSIGLEKTIQAEYLGLISLQVGVSIVKVLRAQGFDDVELKWPNDILLQGKKLGGILIESRVSSPGSFYLVIGFGLNVNLEQAEMGYIDQPAIGLNQSSRNVLDRQQLLSTLIPQIHQDVMTFDLHRVDSLIEHFNQYDGLQGKQVLVKTTSENITGIHLGIQRTGQIKVQTHRGVELFSAAEISLREIDNVVN